MKAFYYKFFSPAVNQNIRKWKYSSLRKFSTFSVEVKNGQVHSSNGNNAYLNWELAKVWVNPLGAVHHNSVNGKQSGDASEECQVTADVKPIEYERFLRKFGLVISRESNVFVQDGVYNSKNVRLVTSDKEDAELFSQILQPSGQNSVPDVHVLLLSNNNNIGSKRRFAYASKTKKTVLTNSRSAENFKKAIDLI